MINFSLHVSGPRIQALIALANGEYRPTGSTIVINRMERDGLIQRKTVPSTDIEGVTLSVPTITERGRMVVALLEGDVAQYLSRIGRGKKKPQG